MVNQSEPETRVAPFNGRKRPRIGVFIDWITDGYTDPILDEIISASNEHDIDVLCFVGGLDLADYPVVQTHRALRYASPDNIDAVLVVSVGNALSATQIAETFKRFEPLPIASVAVHWDEYPRVVVDNETGVKEGIRHLIQTHQCRRIACIRGPEVSAEAQARYRAYREVLAEHGFDYDPALEATGTFYGPQGGDAVRLWLDERKVHFDAIVAANDGMAMGALDELERRGIRVPEDVALFGFDDIEAARQRRPPLTTVRQPGREHARKAFDVLLAQMKGQRVPQETKVSTQLVIRRSCGCVAFTKPLTSAPLPPSLAPIDELIESWSQKLVSPLLDFAGFSGAHNQNLSEALLCVITGGESTSFLRSFEVLLEQATRKHLDVIVAFQALADMRRQAQCRLGDSPEFKRVDALLNDAGPLVAEVAERAQAAHRYRNEELVWYLSRTNEDCLTVSNLASLSEKVASRLHHFGIDNCYICTTDDSGSESSARLQMACAAGSPLHIPDSNQPFPVSEILPHGLLEAETPRVWLVMPLIRYMIVAGYTVIERGAPEGFVYEGLANQLGSAFLRIQLLDQVVSEVQRRELAERERHQKELEIASSIQERAASARRMESLKVLAGGVAHDLNNVLGPLVGLPDVMLAELVHFDFRTEGADTFRADLETMRSATLRASQTIKDLLTLSRQGRTVKEKLDLNHIVLKCLSADSLQGLQDAFPQTPVVCDTNGEPLVICGSAAHISRAVTNLVRNAAEAVLKQGEIRIKTLGVSLKQPVQGYETVPAGDYAVVVVSDNGVGIPSKEIGWVFEPFTSKKRVSDTSGTGLGLAIVHGVVQEHEGYVDVASEVGVGTTFTLYFPRVNESLGPAEERGPARGGSARILVIDDEPVQLRTARRLLTHLGYAVETVSTGEKAISLFADASARGHSPYDLVLLDMMLNGELDGLQVFDEIRRRFPLQRAIVVSGHAPTARVERALAEGIGWLAKPYTQEALANAVGEALSGYVADRRSSTKIKCLSPSRMPPSLG